MDDDTLLPIGAVARRTGLTVKTIRFYADRGIVAPSAIGPNGFRRYDSDAIARLELVRTLRALGLDLDTVRQVLARERTVPEVAAAHADALDLQIRILRQRRAVLRAVAQRATDTEEMNTMHRLATLTDAERRRIIHDFVDDAFGGVDANPELVELLRATVPDLPEDPAPNQVRAWMELAELAQDADFRAAVRRMAEYQARERANGDTTGLHHELTEAVRDLVGSALAAGTAPDTPEAAEVVDELTARYARTFGRADDAELRRWLLERLTIASDARVERYWRLVAAVNGWPAPQELAGIFDWFTAALRTVPATRP
ncbi:MerR family transcriptional regulator [Nocardia xishanensis]|uniref:MerR family transcriptional regulator n=1 Tax=Nocardia xishanensis TaxID=238964 RepID=UPI00082F502B|nr:MerR family transcriptional regulator [Nocardia xishanensis]